MSDDVQPLAGKTVLVTGATDGIGRVTALRLAELGAQVVGVGRDAAKAERVATELTSELPAGARSPVFLTADLSVQAETRALAATYRERFGALDVLVNNVGACFFERQESVDGFEKTWALNHLSYVLLTRLLLEPLCEAPQGRVVTVASTVHRGARIAFDDLQAKKRYHHYRAYRQSKLANVLFAYELARRLEGTRVTSNALHPGVVATAFVSNRLFFRAKHLLAGFLTMTPEQGARTSVHLASDLALSETTGQYFERERAVRSSRRSYDEESARRLWDICSEQCGLS